MNFAESKLEQMNELKKWKEDILKDLNRMQEMLSCKSEMYASIEEAKAAIHDSPYHVQCCCKHGHGYIYYPEFMKEITNEISLGWALHDYVTKIESCIQGQLLLDSYYERLKELFDIFQ